MKLDRTYEEHKINTSTGEAILNKGLYVINQDFIQVRLMEPSNELQGSEIFYSEHNASPVPTRPLEPGFKDPSSRYLDDFIYKNALEQTGDPAVLSMAQGLVNAIRPLLEPANLFKLVFFGAVIYQLILGALYG